MMRRKRSRKFAEEKVAPGRNGKQRNNIQRAFVGKASEVKRRSVCCPEAISFHNL